MNWTSLIVTIINNKISNAKPVLKIISWTFADSSFPLMAWIIYNTKWPPSRTGIGSKFAKPKFIEIIAINQNINTKTYEMYYKLLINNYKHINLNFKIVWKSCYEYKNIRKIMN